MINISFLEIPLEYENIGKLKDNMALTGALSDNPNSKYNIQPLYQNKNIPFENLHRMVKSDFRQYSAFSFHGGYKQSERFINEKQDLLILDIDENYTIKEAKEKFKDYKYFLCTTKSHQKDKKGIKCDRFRMIFKSNNIPKGEDYFLFCRELETLLPFIDKQVNTKTGAFLGYSDCEYWYNDGRLFDCSNIMKVAKDRMKLKEDNKTQRQNDFKATHRQKVEYNDSLPIEEIKQLLTRETVADIVSSLGFDVNRKFMFKYRLDERSPSASISDNINPLVKDFGSDLSVDCIGFVQEVKNCSFKEAVEYVGSFTNVQTS